MEYKMSPLIEAVFEIAFEHDFGEYDPTLPGLFYSKISNKFPYKKEIPNFKYDIINHDGSEKQVNATLSRFSDDNGNHIQLTKDYLVFNKVKPEVNWKIFSQNILMHTQEFIEINGNDKVGYCNLKYLNIIEIPKETSLGDYFKFTLALPPGEDFNAISFTTNITEFEYKGSLAKVTFKTISPTETHNRNLLEIAILNVDGFVYSNGNIESWLNTSHEYICEIFEAAVTTDKLI